MAIPAKLQNDLRQFQKLQQDLSTLGQQRLQMDMKFRETVRTLEEVEALPEDATLYRPIGGLLVKAKGRKDVTDLLTEEKETLEIRVKALERQETHMKERFDEMQKQLTQALQAAGLSTTGGPE